MPAEAVVGQGFRTDRGGAYHWREYRIADLLPDASSFTDMLLLGCGDAGEVAFLSGEGFRTTAFDIRPSSRVDFVGDAHAIPVADASFDIVLSMQVLEHLHSPWIAAQEMSRVLRPGGWCMGSVAFLKPYHSSYFHMSHLGVARLLESAGLAVDTLYGAQSLTYSTLGAMAPLGSRKARRFAYGVFERCLLGFRSMVWSRTRACSPDRPLGCFNSPIPLSFRDFDKLRFAPAVVFRTRKSGNVGLSGPSAEQTNQQSKV